MDDIATVGARDRGSVAGIFSREAGSRNRIQCSRCNGIDCARGRNMHIYKKSLRLDNFDSELTLIITPDVVADVSIFISGYFINGKIKITIFFYC